MNNLKKLLLVLSFLLLVSLACNAVTGAFDNDQPQPAISNNDAPISVEPEDTIDDAVPLDNEQPEDAAPVEQPDTEQPDTEQPDTEQPDAEQPSGQVDSNGTITAIGDAAGVEIIEMNWEIDEQGYITFVGLLQNNSDIELSWVELKFTLRNADGTPVGSGSAYSALDVLPAGSISPFAMYFYDPPYDPWASYEILIEGDENQFFTSYTDFEVIDAVLEDDDFGYQLVGEIKNVGAEEATFVAINAIFYNSAGDPISYDFTYIDADALEPGASSSFLLYVWDTFGDQIPDHFTLFVDGNVVTE